MEKDKDGNTLTQIQNGLTQITVSGYKSISQEQSIEIKPLTILAGANSSGKSSIMQPLLLLKQTLEASFDPGALLLNGPNVKFTSADQLLSHPRRDDHPDTFYVGATTRANRSLTSYFKRDPSKGFEIAQMVSSNKDKRDIFRPRMTNDEILAIIPSHLRALSKMDLKEKREFEWVVVRNRCFLEVALRVKGENEEGQFEFRASPVGDMESQVREVIHLPGLRGNPIRTYPVTAIGATFPGTFENYVASVICQWQEGKNRKLEDLNHDLVQLGLTWKVSATRIEDTQVELQVGRLSHAARGGAHDLVNIADVGFGISQTLPVVVALHAAEPGQLVYLEQPEIHLHPRAQSAMARTLANAAKRGVRVVAETHSSLLLLGLQTIVAEGDISPEMVKLHWFKRNDNGSTEVTSTNLDEKGAFGTWPEDFADVILEAEDRYLNAAESRATYGAG